MRSTATDSILTSCDSLHCCHSGRVRPALACLAASKLPARYRTRPRIRCDLRPALDEWGVQLRPQGTRGTCSVFTVAAAIEYALAKSGQPGNCLSVEFLNWASNQAAGEADDGSFFSDLWSGFEKHGVCDEEEMPYCDQFDPERQPSPGGFDQRTTDGPRPDLTLHWIKPWDPNKGLNDEQLAAVKATLQAGWPVCGGFLWPKEAKWSDDVLGWAPREGCPRRPQRSSSTASATTPANLAAACS